MNTLQLSEIVTLLISLSIASERLVEIFKGFVPFLNTEIVAPAGATTADVEKAQAKEGRRKSVLQLMAVLSGIMTACLAKPVLQGSNSFFNDGYLPYLALGLLASGGSGFWNSILTYFTKVKDIKVAQAEAEKRRIA